MVGAAFPLPLPPPPMVRLPSIGGGGNSHVPSSVCAFPPCSLPDSLTIFSSPKLHLPPPSTDPPLKGLPAMPTSAVGPVSAPVAPGENQKREWEGGRRALNAEIRDIGQAVKQSRHLQTKMPPKLPDPADVLQY